jgi:hypothetical protein
MPSGIFMTKKRRLHPGEVWWEALCDFRNKLHEHVEEAKKDQRRFQTGRLFRSLIKRIKAEATGKDQWVAMLYCYHFVTGISRHLGYDEARRLHGEEMAAKRMSSLRSFCSRPVSDLDELMFRFRSIAFWIEAQESFWLWLVFKELRPAWRGNRDERAHAIQACYLSQLPQRLLRPELGVGTNYDNKPWNARQWKNILEQAARLTEKTYDCTELEQWVWWCYPVFQRYGWNAREVLECCCARFLEDRTGLLDKDEDHFRRYWMARGLRFAGKKQNRNRTPLLAEFVRNVVLSNPGTVWGSLGGFLTQKN